jgi:hypothetical protein
MSFAWQTRPLFGAQQQSRPAIIPLIIFAIMIGAVSGAGTSG